MFWSYQRRCIVDSELCDLRTIIGEFEIEKYRTSEMQGYTVYQDENSEVVVPC